MPTRLFWPLALLPLLLPFGCSEPLAESNAQDRGDQNDVATPLARHETASAAPNWPNWMGPDHDGISHESNWSTDWPESGLPAVWEQDIGIGFSSVAIDGNRLCTMGHTDGTESVYCFNAATGKLLWQHSYPSALVDNLYEGGPGSTPTIEGEFVYTLGKEGQLYCLRLADGDVVWTKDLQQDLDVPLPEWGFNSSAFILGDQLLFEAGRLVSYDKRTGDKNWQSEKHTAGYGSVIDFSHEGNTLITSLDCEAVRVTDPSDGRELASFPWDSPFQTNATTPIVHEDTIFVSTGYQIGCGLFRFADGDLELLYDNREMRNHFNNCILLDGKLYGFDGNSNLGRVVQLKCMDYATGDVQWGERGFGCGSLMIADGKLIILSEQGQLIAARATPEGYEELAQSDFLEGRCWSVPVLLDGKVYARNATGTLRCVQLPAAD